MSEHRNKNSCTSPALWWRFGLRDLLVFLTCASLYLGALTVILRHLGNRSMDAVTLIRWLSLTVIVLVLYFRSSAKRNMGQVDFRLTRRWRPLSWLLTYGWIPLLLLFIVPFMKTGGRLISDLQFSLLMALTYSAVLASVSAMNKSVALGENGIVYDGMWFVPWQPPLLGKWLGARPMSYRIDEDGTLTLGRGWLRTEAHVPAESRDSVEALLRGKLAAKQE